MIGKSRRDFFKLSGAVLATTALPSMPTLAGYKSTSNAGVLVPKAFPDPISRDEFESRVKKAQNLMAKSDINALVLEPGASMRYFSGIEWWLSERLTCVVIPREGTPFVVTPEMEYDNINQFSKIDVTVHIWSEHESSYKLLAEQLKARKLDHGKIAFEETVRYFVMAGIMSHLPEMKHVSGDPIVRTCRRIKSVNELKLLHKAQEITLAAYAETYRQLEKGMTGAELKTIMQSATTQLGGKKFWGLALSDAEAALPHGFNDTHVIKDGSAVLMDCGCTVEGYNADISRTFFVGTPSKKQVDTWNTVRQGLDVVAKHAQIGNPASLLDKKVREFYESKGFGPGYMTPGLTHRAGHGIGADLHEEPYLVKGNDTPLESGMCFSNEPGLYIPGEFGVRIEEIMYLTKSGPKWFTNPPESHESPIGTLAPLSLDV